MYEIALTPPPPYYAVIFTSIRTEIDNSYSETADRILGIARQQPGFLGYESARNGLGISVSYWESLDAIKAWRQHPEHRKVQSQAVQWYSDDRVRICKVEKCY